MGIVQELVPEKLPEPPFCRARVFEEIEKANASTEQKEESGQNGGLPMHEQAFRQTVE